MIINSVPVYPYSQPPITHIQILSLPLSGFPPNDSRSKKSNPSSNLRLLLLVLLVLHALHDPPARLLGILVRRLLVLHNLLHLAEVIRHVHALVDGWTLLDRLQPGLDFGETAGFDAGPFAPVDCKKKKSISVIIDEESLVSTC